MGNTTRPVFDQTEGDVDLISSEQCPGLEVTAEDNRVPAIVLVE